MYEDEILVEGDQVCSRCNRMFYTFSRGGMAVCNNCAPSEDINSLFEVSMIEKLQFLTG